MSVLTTKLSAITSSSDTVSFLTQLNNKRAGWQIGVQPTSLSRRKIGLTLRSKRVQIGRLTENIASNEKNKKKSSNVNDNKSNSKSHWRTNIKKKQINNNNNNNVV
jgi:hypothetical protein